ncbi:MAG: 2-amino-4-hydroxy-6-hydroxymethyldihydropteridine diphosphokinase [Marinilabiliales bacterium]
MKTVILITGSNLGNRKQNLDDAKNHIEQIYKITVTSSIYESEPWGYNDSTNYLNQIIVIKTNNNPQKILSDILEIEKKMGRIREGNYYTARIIDIDILFYENEIINTHDLKIPHPQLHKRKFVLLPMIELFPGWIHPILKKTVTELLEICEDNSQVIKI